MTDIKFLRGPQAIFLMGPTASGKTGLTMKLHKHLPVEVISVDSAMIYCGMDIGTAKPSANKLSQVPHRLINIRDPSEPYSAAIFCCDALKEMAKIIEAGRIPLLVGGTIFYFKALLEGLSPLPPADTLVRAQIEREAETVGWQVLYRQLQQIDPIAASRIHPRDSQRLSRALEVFLVSGKTQTELTKISGKALAYRVYQFAIAPFDRALLHQRIVRRFHQMLNDGFEHEVSMLFTRDDLHREMPSIRCIGYRQMWSYLAGETDYDNMIFHGICATRQLAKRQMTWLRSWQGVHWLDSNKPVAALDRVLKIISQ